MSSWDGDAVVLDALDPDPLSESAFSCNLK